MINFKVAQHKLTTARGEQTFHFARAVYNGETTMDMLQKQIARISAISEGDVRSVLLTLSQLVADELSAGRVIELGDLGRMKVGLKSKASDSKDKFRSQDIKRVHVIFTPGKMIREELLSVGLQCVNKNEDGTCPVKKPKEEDNASVGSDSDGKGKDPSGDSDKDYTGL